MANGTTEGNIKTYKTIKNTSGDSYITMLLCFQDHQLN